MTMDLKDVLAVGRGTFLEALAAALLSSGRPKVHVLLLGGEPADHQRLTELAERFHHPVSDTPNSNPPLEVMELPDIKSDSWQKTVQAYASVLYVSEAGYAEEAKALNAFCKQNNKLLIPALLFPGTGMAGPLVHPASQACWASAWRRVHQNALADIDNGVAADLTDYASGEAMLANVLVAEWEKFFTGSGDSYLDASLYLLNLHTLTGGFHSFLPHPIENTAAQRFPGEPPTEAVLTCEADWENLLAMTEAIAPEAAVSGVATGAETETEDKAGAKLIVDLVADSTIASEFPKAGVLNIEDEWFSRFQSITSPETGIFHLWEEGELSQLPLHQCRVQPVDPLSEGPAQLLPVQICAGLTHLEARREAALAGLEAYTARWLEQADSGNNLGIGAGLTLEESIMRALHNYLAALMVQRLDHSKLAVLLTVDQTMMDRHCRYYWQALTTMGTCPQLALGEKLHGFPVIGVRTHNRWTVRVGITYSLVLREVLIDALQLCQNNPAGILTREENQSAVLDDPVPTVPDEHGPTVLDETDPSPRKSICPVIQECIGLSTRKDLCPESYLLII